MTVLCLIEIDAGRTADVSIRAAIVASALAASAGEDLSAAWFGPSDAIDHRELSAAGIARAYSIESDELAGYAPLAWARALAGLAAGLPDAAGQVSAVVAANTDHGNEVLAHLGAITGLSMAANCVSAARVSPGEVRLVRQRWGGSLLEEALLSASLALLTIAADSVAAPPPAPLAPDSPVEPAAWPPVEPAAPHRAVRAALLVRPFRPELEPGDLLVAATASAERRTGVSLATARFVVGGGRGVGSAEGFAELEELAGLLDAAVGVSRVVTSQGWRPHQQQVGQTGTKITPDLYLACGISGAIQHMAGCQGAKNIVVINTDANAPIIARANYAVIGDLHQIIPALITALKRRASGLT